MFFDKYSKYFYPSYVESTIITDLNLVTSGVGPKTPKSDHDAESTRLCRAFLSGIFSHENTATSTTLEHPQSLEPVALLLL